LAVNTPKLDTKLRSTTHSCPIGATLKTGKTLAHSPRFKERIASIKKALQNY